MQQILCRWWSLTGPLKIQDLGLGFIFEMWSLSCRFSLRGSVTLQSLKQEPHHGIQCPERLFQQPVKLRFQEQMLIEFWGPNSFGT